MTALRAMLVLVTLALLVYLKPWLSDKGEAESAHGISLPSEASEIKTVGDWRRGFLDRGATTIFSIDSEHIDSFISSLPIAKPYNGIGPPGPPSNGIYHRGLKKSWSSEQQPSQSAFLNSPVGDHLTFEVYDISQEVSAVRIYTDWN